MYVNARACVCARARGIQYTIFIWSLLFFPSAARLNRNTDERVFVMCAHERERESLWASERKDGDSSR